MKCLEQIYKENRQDKSQIHKQGKFEFNDKAGCMVYMPACSLKNGKT